MSNPKDPTEGPGAALLLGFLPEILRRATNMDRICRNCGRYDRKPNATDGRCSKAGFLLPQDGPPWAECRWFDPSEEFKSELAKRPRLGDILAEENMKPAFPKKDKP